MTVADLQSYTEETLMGEVERKGVERMLVPPWLDANSLRPLLRVVEQASLATATGPQLLPLGDLAGGLRDIRVVRAHQRDDVLLAEVSAP